jgi:hypothetical protein
LPGGLIVLAAAIAISAGLGLSDHGVKVVGTIPTGLPGGVVAAPEAGRPVGAAAQRGRG